MYNPIETFTPLLIETLTAIQGVDEQGKCANQVIINKLSNYCGERQKHPQKIANAATPLPNHLQHYLHDAANNPAIPKQLQPLAQQLLVMAPSLRWYQRQPAVGVAPFSEPFANHHANAYIIGSQEYPQRQDLAVGVTLVAPNITYVDHQHPPEEIYLVLSDSYWRQRQQPWQRPGIGGFIYNSPNIVHAMQSSQTPLLAIWCLNITD